jgi:hypothetical protein
MALLQNVQLIALSGTTGMKIAQGAQADSLSPVSLVEYDYGRLNSTLMLPLVMPSCISNLVAAPA